jgi:Tol biopolymer transport system component
MLPFASFDQSLLSTPGTIPSTAMQAPKDHDLPHGLRRLVLPLLLLVATGLSALVPHAASGQLFEYNAQYRPPLDYQSVETKHFTFIFPAGTDTTTVLFRRALTTHFDQTASITGTETESFELPVIVDPLSDLANGFAAPLNLRTTLFTAHPTRALGAKFDSWAQTVAPHELTHTMHYETDSGIGVGGLVGLFSEDISRTLHGLQLDGWSEGIAVYRESQMQPNAGRLNAPLFTMKYRAAVGSDDPWSLGELMYEGVVERPMGRHYLGGGQFVEYLVDERGSTDFIRRTNQWYHRLPFLGPGVALWIGTGDLPAELSDDFLAAERKTERRRLDSLSNVTNPTVVAGTDGLHVRRPYWLSDSTLVAYASGYATTPGFYRVDAHTGTREAIRHTNITTGRTYALGPDSSALYFARTHLDPVVPRKILFRPHRLDLRSGTVRTVSPATGTFTPAEGPRGTVWAAQRDGSFSTLVTLHDEGRTTQADRPGLRYKQVAPSPTGDTIAVLANAAGRQGLYRTAPGDSSLEPWLRFEEGAIYDVSWGPEGRYLLFAADPSGIANVYALNTETDRVRRLTTVRYGALEPTLSPDGKTLAFARYQHERFELATLPFRPADARRANGVERRWTASDEPLFASAGAEGSNPPGAEDRTLGEAAADLSATSRPYRAWHHLAPRSVFPRLKGASDLLGADPAGEDLGLGPGLQIAGTDPLQRWTYRLSGFYQAERVWGEGSLETGRLPGTPSVSAFVRPLEGVVRTEAGESRLAAFEERGIGLQIGQGFPLERNVYTTLLRAELEGQYRQIRPITATGRSEGPFIDVVTAVPSLNVQYRTQTNLRDLMPNTGVVSRTDASADVLAPDESVPRRYLRNETEVYWPLLSNWNVGLRSSAAVLTQSRTSLFDAQSFAPRGYRDLADALPDAGTHLRLGAKYVQPLWYVDTGSVLLPVALDAVYGFGLGQAQYRIDGGPSFRERRASVGAGLGLKLRLLGLLPLNLEAGVSYRFDVDPEARTRWAPYVGPGSL